MNRRLSTAILLPAFVLTAASLARAQLQDNIEINVFGGGSFFTQKEFQVSYPQSTVPFQGAFRLTKTVRAGLRVGVYTRGHWSEEFFYSYEPSTAHFIRRSAPASSVNLRLGIHNVGVTALYYFQENEARSIRPFLSVGVGGTLYRFTPEAKAFARDPLRGNLPGLNNNSELELNYGVGLKSRMSNWLGFRADLRGFLGRVPSFGLPRESTDPNAPVFPATGPLNNGEASAGLIFYFFNRR